MTAQLSNGADTEVHDPCHTAAENESRKLSSTELPDLALLAADLTSTFLGQRAAFKAPLPQERPDDKHAFCPFLMLSGCARPDSL